MKKLKKLKLSELSKAELEKRQMKVLKGGDDCGGKCGTVRPPSGSTTKDWHGYFYD